ncbi:hypothetical protein L1987_17926 [Smallanthus sonchifolius]|uniref:Uncharacterized protein n=1 Tax=Smallanthus sonchifolius TaxID=185202 RepID=A0ACB9IZT7_9ASTR|nr:hypothetical protein L1987_17926 [Smallanthus sonchifolius]
MESNHIDDEYNFTDSSYEASSEDEESLDSLSIDLEEKDLVTTLNRTSDDPFLNKLCYENMQLHFTDEVGETLLERDDDGDVRYMDGDNDDTQHVEKGIGSLVTASWIAKMYLRQLVARPFVRIRDMQADILRDYMVKVSRGQCYRAKSMAMFEIESGLKEHYARIWDYAHEILRTNPGSSVKVGENGELLTAVGQDANNQIYPIVWAVVEVENKDNWKWFLECLKDDIGMCDGRAITFISDQHKGLVEAVKDLFPHVEHRQCARHIYANFKKKYNGVELGIYFGRHPKQLLSMSLCGRAMRGGRCGRGRIEQENDVVVEQESQVLHPLHID